jgi:hypothetical protein
MGRTPHHQMPAAISGSLESRVQTTKKVVHQVAAVLILQGYLDAIANRAEVLRAESGAV